MKKIFKTHILILIIVIFLFPAAVFAKQKPQFPDPKILRPPPVDIDVFPARHVNFSPTQTNKNENENEKEISDSDLSASILSSFNNSDDKSNSFFWINFWLVSLLISLVAVFVMI